MNRKQRRIQQSENKGKASVTSDPGQAAVYNNQGIALHEQHQYTAALESYNKAIALNPDYAEAYSNRGNIFQSLRQWDAALASHDQAIALKPDFAEAYFNRGTILQELKQLDAALASYNRAIALNPNLAEAYSNRGTIHKELKQWDAALASYNRAIALKPNLAEAYSNRGTIHKELKQWDAALADYDKAIALRADYAEAYSNRGAVLQELKEWEATRASYDRAIALRADYAEAYHNRGTLFQHLEQWDNALSNYNQAIMHKPDYADAHINKSYVLLLTGCFTDGWKEFEWRWKLGSLKPRASQTPAWLGQGIPKDKIILVYAEQGFGDVLQFCRYIPMLARNHKVIFECYQGLVSFMQYNFPDIKVVPLASDYPGTKGLPEHDYHTPLMSLPLAFGTALETIPSRPYLKAQPEYVAQWRPILDDALGRKFRVGLCWAGGKRPDSVDCTKVDARRSLTFEQIKPLLNVEGTSFISLQLGPPKLEINDERVKDVSSHIKDWSDTAAIIAQLDLVISADTSVCHLAAAMGKPTYLLNRYDTCWRWLLARDDSPWYPSLKQFRQNAAGDWESVIARVEAELRQLEKQKTSGDHK